MFQAVLTATVAAMKEVLQGYPWVKSFDGERVQEHKAHGAQQPVGKAWLDGTAWLGR